MTPPIDHKAGPSPLQWFLAEIDRVPDGELTGAKVRDLLRAMAGRRFTVSAAQFTRLERMRQAEAMIANGLPVSEVRARLPVRASVSKRTAERIVTLILGGRSPKT